MNTDSPRLIPTGSGESVFFGGRNLYPGEEPSDRAHMKAERLPLRPKTLYLISSPLLWYGVEALLKRASQECRFLAVEADSSLAQISDSRIPRRFHNDPRCRYLSVPSDRELIEQLYELGIHRLRRCEVISLNGGYRLYRRQYGHIAQLLQNEIERFWQHKATLVHMMPLWLSHIFKNLALHTQGIAAPDICTHPALVVGAGPSLDEYVPLIRELQERLFIIAVDTAYAPLRNSGVLPDVVVLQEGQIYNQYDFLQFPKVDGIVLADLSSHSGILRRLSGAAGGYRLFFTEFTGSTLFDRMEAAGVLPPFRTPPLGSVGSTAVHAALQLCSREVVVCGVDFAFPEGRTHAKGSAFHINVLLNAHRFNPPTGELVRAKPGIRTLQQFPQHSRNEEMLDAQSSTNFTASHYYTAPVIDAYVRSFARRFAGEGRLRRLGPGREDMDLRCITPGELRELVHEEHEKPADYSGPLDSATSVRSGGAGHTSSRTGGTTAGTAEETKERRYPPTTAQVRAFLEGERELLKECYRLGKMLLYSEGGDRERRELTACLYRVDYLYLYFPDTGTMPPELTPTMLKRLLVSAERFRRQIEQALQMIE